MTNKIRETILRQLIFNDNSVTLNRGYDKVFTLIMKRFNYDNEDNFINDMDLEYIDIEYFNEHDKYNDIIGLLIQKNVFNKYGINIKEKLIDFDLYIEEGYTYNSLRFEVKLNIDKDLLLKKISNIDSKIVIGYSKFGGILYSFNNVKDEKEVYECYNKVNKIITTMNNIKDDIQEIRIFLTENIN